MQNKARLELADYEAVSTLSFWFSDCQEALSSMLSLCMDHNMMTLWISRFPAETGSSGGLEMPISILPTKKPSHCRLLYKLVNDNSCFSGAPFGRMQCSHLQAPKIYTRVSIGRLGLSRSIQSQEGHYCSADLLLVCNSNALHFNILNYSLQLLSGRLPLPPIQVTLYLAASLLSLLTCPLVGTQNYSSLCNEVAYCIFDRCLFCCY